jgi:Tol biopolymer transport system component
MNVKPVIGNGQSTALGLSGNGRYVVFASGASNLVVRDKNAHPDVFVRDIEKGVTELISTSSSGEQGNGPSGWVANYDDFQGASTTDHVGVAWIASGSSGAISRDGRWVAFVSYASNLVARDTRRVPEIFLRDRASAKTYLVSQSSSGHPGNAASAAPVISADGRYIGFASLATNLVPGDTNGTADVFVHDRVTGVTTQVSVSSAGEQGADHSSDPSISADGSQIAFVSLANDLAPDSLDTPDVFVHNMRTGVTTLESVDSQGRQGNPSLSSTESYEPALSADGHWLVFRSSGRLAPNVDASTSSYLYVRELQKGVTTLVSQEDSGRNASIDSDGSRVVFQGANDDLRLFSRSTGETIHPPGMPAWTCGGDNPQPSISSDGSRFIFTSMCKFDRADTNELMDAYLVDFSSKRIWLVSVG